MPSHKKHLICVRRQPQCNSLSMSDWAWPRTSFSYLVCFLARLMCSYSYVFWCGTLEHAEPHVIVQQRKDHSETSKYTRPFPGFSCEPKNLWSAVWWNRKHMISTYSVCLLDWTTYRPKFGDCVFSHHGRGTSVDRANCNSSPPEFILHLSSAKILFAWNGWGIPSSWIMKVMIIPNILGSRSLALIRFHSCEPGVKHQSPSHHFGISRHYKGPHIPNVVEYANPNHTLLSFIPWNIPWNSHNISKILSPNMWITGWWCGTFVYDFPYIGNFIIPTDELIFFKMLKSPPTRLWLTIINHVLTININHY